SGTAAISGGDASASYLSAPAQNEGVASIPGSQPPSDVVAVPPPTPSDGDRNAKKKRRHRRP
ncbi:MAG: hypothetical protein AAB426_07030, partial [Myxococcota bacterium]